MNKKKSTGLLLSILGVISLVLITAGVTYAFFSYTKEGTTENTITTGAITFRYDEGAANTELNLTDKLPQTDTEANTEQTGYSFTVTSTTPSTAKIPYVVTINKDSTSTMADNQVKIYLTASGSTDATGTNVGSQTGAIGSVVTYSALPTAATFTNDDDFSWYTGSEKILYTGIVPVSQVAGTGNDDHTYNKTFTVKMWIKGTSDGSGMADYSALEFVKKSLATGSSALSVATLLGETDGILTSTDYYTRSKATDSTAITAGDYERIAYVNYTTGQIYIVSQAAADGFNAGTGFEANEQYYQQKGKTFKFKINVYAKGAAVYSETPNNG